MATPLNSEKMIADFEREVESWSYSHESAVLENDTPSATINIVGVPYPVKEGSGPGFIEIMSAAEVAADVIVMLGFMVTNRHEQILDGETALSEYAYLARGNAVVSLEAFPATDPAGASYAVAEFTDFCSGARAAGNANPIIIVRDRAGVLQSTLPI